jgi:hypothetical protein
MMTIGPAGFMQTPKQAETAIELLQKLGYASYFELKKAGIEKVIDKGINAFGFREELVIDCEGGHWDYIPEDEIYELKK